MLKYIIGGVVLVLMGVGGFINYNRERSGECSEGYVKDYLRPELVENYLKRIRLLQKTLSMAGRPARDGCDAR